MLFPMVVDSNSSASDNLLVGATILIVGQVFGALSYIFEEKYLSEFDDAHPLIVVGWEGVWGTLIVTILLIAF